MMYAMNQTTTLAASLGLLLAAGCGGSDAPSAPSAAGDEAAHASGAEDGHEHAEDSLGTALIGDLAVEFAQGHGALQGGKEGHLVVKLPYSDDGATIVRAWIGTDDRTSSYVGKGEYAASHDDYDVHATAPDPLPEAVRWWVEIEQPDGAKLVGSVAPILE
jgi:hypothetical protein